MTYREIREIAFKKVNEAQCLVSVEGDLIKCSYSELKLKMNLDEISSMSNLEIFSEFVSCYADSIMNLYFHDLLSVQNTRVADNAIVVLNILIGGCRAEFENGL